MKGIYNPKKLTTDRERFHKIRVLNIGAGAVGSAAVEHEAKLCLSLDLFHNIIVIIKLEFILQKIHNTFNFLIGNPTALYTDRLRHRNRFEEHIALAEQFLRSLLIHNYTAVCTRAYL